MEGPKAQSVNLIHTHLEGQAEEKIKFHTGIHHEPEEILLCSRSEFGSPGSIISLQHGIFLTQKKERETTREMNMPSVIISESDQERHHCTSRQRKNFV